MRRDDYERGLLQLQSELKKMRDIQRKRIVRAKDLARRKGYDENAFLAISEIDTDKGGFPSVIQPVQVDILLKSGKRKRQSITKSVIGQLSDERLICEYEAAQRRYKRAVIQLSGRRAGIKELQRELQNLHSLTGNARLGNMSFADFEKWAVQNPQKMNNFFRMTDVFEKLPKELRHILHDIIDNGIIEYDIEELEQMMDGDTPIENFLDYLLEKGEHNYAQEVREYLEAIQKQQGDTDDLQGQMPTRL